MNPDNTPVSPILPGAWLGMVGGGQLGRMFCFAAQAMGYRVAVLDPDEASPAGAVADRHMRAAYDDEASLTELARLCAAVSTEFENVPAASLDFLAQHHVREPGRPLRRRGAGPDRREALYRDVGRARWRRMS